MLLLPYAHERQTVQRLPWITFGLIALNIIIFLITTYGSGGTDDAGQYLYDFQEYMSSHPYLKMPKEMEQFYDEDQLDQLAALGEVAKTNLTISEWDMQQEQRTLDSLAEKVLESINQNPLQKYGYIPNRPSFISMLTCMFLHTGWLHLIGNMLFLYLAGCSIEDLWGRPLYSGFYVVGGIVATVAHALKYPSSDVPLIGASGAIAALMGAFLIRLYDTKISFFYMLGFWYRGTFQAPAYIMLPLWLLQQFFEASLLGEVASVAFYAHIGGFVFGAAFAVGMKHWRIEEKYIAPKIEKKVSLAQNPDFLKAMDLSEKGSFPEALILLEKVVRQEPNHMDAFMEMRRISEINKDYKSYSKYTGSIFEILVRNRDRDFLLELYQQFREHPMRQSLPVRTLLTLGSFFEEGQEYDAAMQQYEELVNNYPDDPLAMRAYSKLSRICFDRFNNPERATEAFWNSYYHKSASDQWQKALQADMKRYNIAPRERTAMPSVPPAFGAIAASTAFTGEPSMRTAEGDVVEETTAEIPPAPAPTVLEQPNLARIEPPAATLDRILLPDPSFDHRNGGKWNAVSCCIDKIMLKGIVLSNTSKSQGFLPWRKIRFVSVGRIRTAEIAASSKPKDLLVIDLVARCEEDGSLVAYRLLSNQIAFDKIFPRVDQSFEEAHQNFIGILINNSGATPIPDRDSCNGPRFASFADLARYEAKLKEKLLT